MIFHHQEIRVNLRILIAIIQAISKDSDPLVQRLESLGELLCLVSGALGEVSEDLERTIKAIAEARETGLRVSDAKAGWILGHNRRLLSCLFVRSQASCLLARMGHLGEGTRSVQLGGEWLWRRREG